MRINGRILDNHDGQHDFDFLIGDWNAQLKRLLRPLTGSTDWVEFKGITNCRPIWGGRGNIDEFTVENSSDGAKIEGLTIRLYDPQTQEWSLYWANNKTGTTGLPRKAGLLAAEGNSSIAMYLTVRRL